MSEELLVLAQRLIAFETCEPEGIAEAAGFVEGWLEARGIEAESDEVRGLPVIKAEVGPRDAPTVVLHGHLDVVPGRAGQFEPQVDGDKLYGRGAYDMKGAIAAMLLVTAAMREQDRVRVRLGIVGDEESEEDTERGSDHLVDTGFTGDFAITGEPTDLHIGIEAKGVLALRLEVGGTAAHGATPWLGDNAVLNAIDVFRSIESLPFARPVGTRPPSGGGAGAGAGWRGGWGWGARRRPPPPPGAATTQPSTAPTFSAVSVPYCWRAPASVSATGPIGRSDV